MAASDGAVNSAVAPGLSVATVIDPKGFAANSTTVPPGAPTELYREPRIGLILSAPAKDDIIAMELSCHIGITKADWNGSNASPSERLPMYTKPVLVAVAAAAIAVQARNSRSRERKESINTNECE
jgi:hypothetical protein